MLVVVTLVLPQAKVVVIFSITGAFGSPNYYVNSTLQNWKTREEAIQITTLS